ncbi:MAG: JAB domain-containing protein [Allopontixanthobacter sediminis]
MFSDAAFVGSPVFLQYLQAHFTGASEERFHATYCDGYGRYLDDEVLAIGTSDLVMTRARALFGRALALGASGLLLAHNHPSGRCHPSSEDLIATDRVRDIARALDIVLLDHLILTCSQIYSIRLGEYL